MTGVDTLKQREHTYTEQGQDSKLYGRFDRSSVRRVCLALFIVYIIFMVYFLVFSDLFGRGMYEERHYNLQPFQEIGRFLRYGSQMSEGSAFLNLYGNIIAFVPFGMLLRWARNKNTTFVQAFAYSLGFTLTIETAQYITKLGVFDVDDIILNTAGGMVGYCIYYVTAKLLRRNHAKKQGI